MQSRNHWCTVEPVVTVNEMKYWYSTITIPIHNAMHTRTLSFTCTLYWIKFWHRQICVTRGKMYKGDPGERISQIVPPSSEIVSPYDRSSKTVATECSDQIYIICVHFSTISDQNILSKMLVLTQHLLNNLIGWRQNKKIGLLFAYQ